MICEKCGKEHDGSFASGRFCSRSCANGRPHTEEQKNNISKGVKNSEKFWANLDLSIRKRYGPKKILNDKCLICGKQIKPGNHACAEHKNQYISQRVTGKTGGFRNYGGNGKSGIYKGFLCQSSWELAWLLYHLDKGDNVKRCKESFPYVYEGKEKKYYPDFIIDNVYYEIKWKRSPGFSQKLEQFPKDKTLILIEGKEINPYISYAKEKYGDFVQLYDRRW